MFNTILINQNLLQPNYTYLALSIIAIIILIIFSFIISMVEAGFMTVSPAIIEQLSNDKEYKYNKKALKVFNLLKNPNKFLTTIQVVNTLIAFINGAIASSQFNDFIYYIFGLTIDNPNYTLFTILITVFITLFIAYFQITFGEVVAKRVGMKYSLKVSIHFTIIPILFYYPLFPFIWFLSVSTQFFASLFGVKKGDEIKRITEEDIISLSSSASDKGQIDKEESEMIENIFEFDDTDVYEVMTHRTEIVSIDVSTSKDELFEMIATERYTRYPVYENTVDNVIGILHVKDVLKYLNDTDSFNIKDVLREPYFVPESKKINTLFYEMKKTKTHIAIVIDEYGGLAGVITIEDLIEEIIGDIDDEFDDLEKHITQIEDDHYISDGLIDLDSVEDELSINLPIEQYDTLSGFMISLIERLPLDDEVITVVYNGYKFQSLEILNKVITKVDIKKIQEDEENNNLLEE